MSAPLPVLTDTWNAIGTAFTAIKMTVTDTASAAGSKLFDLIVGSTHMFQVGKNGHAAVGAGSQIDNDPNWIGAAPILLELSESLTTFGSGTYGLVLTQQFDLTEDTGNSAIGAAITVYVASSTVANLGDILVGAQLNVEADNTGNIDAIYSMNGSVTKRNGTISNIYNTSVGVRLINASASSAYGYRAQFYFEGDDPGVAHADTVYGFAPSIESFGTWTATNFFSFWSPSLDAFSANITNPYYWWTDGPGVTRIREEGATKGGVYAWYNPAFTKYTPGAVNFERGILQWNTGNVLEIGAEAGGTGTLRKVRHLGAGHIFPLANLPTSDPGVAGQLFTSGAPSAGVPKALMISGG